MPRTIAGSAAMPRRAIVNSFGAGGAYAALVLEEAPPQPAIPSPARPHMFAISGPDRDALRRRLLQLQVMAADARQGIDLGALAATLWGLEAPFAFRTAIVAGSRDGLEDGFRQALAANVPDGLFHGGIAAGAAPGAESRAEDWLAGHRIVRPGPAIPLQLPPYPFDHRERFAIGQPAADLPFDLDFSKIVSGELTEAAFAALLRT
jgi:acyl transferase domain-containing protein